ncbi:hypothetical protein S40293_07755 [Stachybotrys chartarum IBT 40293]|nr:hypothetical protein S40293_07755 [Stachybotrys chartarum IBT 40293]
MRLQVLVYAVLASVSSAQFFNPPQRNGVFHVGEIETIRYHTTFDEYVLAIWQEVQGGGAAILGPVVYETTKGPSASFEWVVQTYDFDLEGSNLFFFWIFQGTSALVDPGEDVISGYFNITNEPRSSSSVPTQTTLSTSIASTSEPTTSAGRTTTTQTSAAPAETSSSGTTTNEGQRESGQAGASQSSGTSGGLPMEAMIGIGVGAGVVGVCALVALVFWFRYLRRKQALLAEAQQREQQHQDWQRSVQHGSMYKAQYAHQPPAEMEQSAYVNSRGPVEIAQSPWRNARGAVEMS